jgi:hypothetical protein
MIIFRNRGGNRNGRVSGVYDKVSESKGLRICGFRYIRDLSIQFLLGCTQTNGVKLLWQNRDKTIYGKSHPKFIYFTLL